MTSRGRWQVTAVSENPYEVCGVLADGRRFLLRERAGNLTVRLAPTDFPVDPWRWPVLPDPHVSVVGFGECTDATAVRVLGQLSADPLTGSRRQTA